jgi:ABC-2 type transport system ATP-binding protein
MSEMALTAEHFVIIGQGRMIADVTAAELEDLSGESTVFVRTAEASRLRTLLTRDGVTVRDEGSDGLSIVGLDSGAIGRVIADQAIVVSELVNRRNSLEQTFMDLTSDAVEYSARTITQAAA